MLAVAHWKRTTQESFGNQKVNMKFTVAHCKSYMSPPHPTLQIPCLVRSFFLDVKLPAT